MALRRWLCTSDASGQWLSTQGGSVGPNKLVSALGRHRVLGDEHAQVNGSRAFADTRIQPHIRTDEFAEEGDQVQGCKESRGTQILMQMCFG